MGVSVSEIGATRAEVRPFRMRDSRVGGPKAPPDLQGGLPSVTSGQTRLAMRRLVRRLIPRTYPTDPSALRDSWIYRQWWYYSVELQPGVVTKGQYPDDFPLLPRILMRNCDLHGATCLDLGSMEGLIPVLMHRGRAARVIATDAIDHCH